MEVYWPNSAEPQRDYKNSRCSNGNPNDPNDHVEGWEPKEVWKRTLNEEMKKFRIGWEGRTISFYLLNAKAFDYCHEP